jgi:hypothetical protein
MKRMGCFVGFCLTIVVAFTTDGKTAEIVLDQDWPPNSDMILQILALSETPRRLDRW